VIGRQQDGEVTIISDRCVGHGFVARVDPGPWLPIASELPIPPKTFVSSTSEPLAVDHHEAHVVELR
jgi:hypothetical protein